MTMPPRCPHTELAVGWGLHALEPGDEAKLIEHLPSCPLCREAIQRTESVIWALGSAHEQIDPRPELRAELMAAVAATPQIPEAQRSAPLLAPSGLPAGQPLTVGWHRTTDTAGAAKAAARFAERRQADRRKRVITVLATVLLAVVGFGAVAFWEYLVSEQMHRAQAISPQQRSQILAQVDRPGARYAVLNAPQTGEPVAAVMLYQGQREVLPLKLTPNDPRHSMYVLWGVADAPPVPLGSFDVNASDQSLRPVGSMGQADRYTSYVVSVEASRAVPASPQLVVATGRVEH